MACLSSAMLGLSVYLNCTAGDDAVNPEPDAPNAQAKL